MVEADALMEAYLDRMLETGNTDVAFIHRSAMARIAYSRGRSADALFLIEAVPLTPAQADTRSMEIPWLFKATLLYMRGSERDVREADHLLDATEQAIANYKVFRFQVALGIAHILRAHRHADETAAQRQFDDLMLETERAGYVRTLLDLGEAFGYLLDRYGNATPYIQMLKHAQHQAPDQGIPQQPGGVPGFLLAGGLPNAPEMNEPLTNREIDVLEGLQQRLSNKEIANNLSISPLTVKTHLRNLYEKLGVNSRRQAIARATELGILQ
jgi:ATP/maltotriose-dependent transcriptional regulator MalT